MTNLSRPARRAVALAAGLAGTVSLSTNLVRETWGGFRYRTLDTWETVPLDGEFAGNDVFLLAIWAGLTLVAARALAVTSRRARAAAAALAVAAALAETLGAALNWDNSLHLLVSSKTQLAKTAIHLTGYWVIFYIVFALLLAACLKAGGQAARRREATAARSAGQSDAGQSDAGQSGAGQSGAGQSGAGPLGAGPLGPDQTGQAVQAGEATPAKGGGGTGGAGTASAAWGWLRRQWGQHRRRFVFGIWLTLCLSRVPYLLAWYPAVLTVDAENQLEQALGEYPLFAHHSLAHTAALAVFGQAGRAVGSVTGGLAAYSVFLIMASSAAFAYVLLALKRWGIPAAAVLGAGAFFALNPLFGMYSVDAEKDVPFALGAMCLVTALVEVLRRRPEFSGGPGRWIPLVAFALVVALWRSNGIYALALAFACLVIWAKGQRRQFLAAAAITGALWALVTGPVSAALAEAPGDSLRESLSLPVQQVARAVHEHHAQLTDQEKRLIADIFSVETWVSQSMPFEDAYYPRLSDWVKNQIDSEYLSAHKAEALELYFELGRRYPKSYINAALAQTFGYWYPEAIEHASQSYQADNPWGISADDSLAPGLRKAMTWAAWGSPRPVPVVSMFFSIGFYFGLTVLAATALVIKRRARLALALTPLAGIWGTALLSPGFAEFRYVLALACAAPVVALVAWRARG
ncbi:MAG: DUF6020 family protein [Bifidobacteriaceae bacterium]|jgi:hypothetical protein|nr:DUF6020 family protein [Bifidobacteriaceae bacterium]